MDRDEFLQHYGVLGMKWGRRKSRGSTGGSRPTSSHEPSEDYINKLTLKSKPLHSMSNKEIRAFTERLQLEKTYKELTKKELSPGKKFLKELFVDSGKANAKKYVTMYMGKGIEAMIKKAFGTAAAKEAAKATNDAVKEATKITTSLVK